MSLKLRMARLYRCMLTRISPKLNTMVVYHSKFGRKLDLEHPVTLNEKNLWLKFNTYWNNPLIKECADKYLVRKYVERAGCSKILNELITSYDSPEKIDWDKLPDRYAIKLNIGSGYNLIVSDKNKLNRVEAEKRIASWFKKAPKCYLGYSEMQYKDVKPVIIVEKYLGGPNGELPEDYKFYCINGRCEMIMLCKDRQYDGHGAKYFYYDREWNQITNGLNDPSLTAERPVNLEAAIQYAEILSKPFPYVRVDLYLIGDLIYFGELTFTPAAGMDVDHKLKPFGCDEDLDHIYGRILKLPNK